MIKQYFLSLGCMFFVLQITAQKYEFQTVKDIEALPIISQDQTGTCWSFSTTSFLESEIFRISGKKIDLSEMYNVRQTYTKKAFNYVMRQGKAQFGEGGLNHDIINSAREFGLMPQEIFGGYTGNIKTYNHSKMVEELTDLLKKYADPSQKLDPEWKNKVSKILDDNFGVVNPEFVFEDKKYTPMVYLESLKLPLNDYVTITSFTHEPFYSSFILSIPDNFSNGSYYNLPLDEYMQNIDNAIDKGFTLALDTDVSEITFSGRYGIAVIPNDTADAEIILQEIKPERVISSEYRQTEFENFDTTDDHLMHIVGKMKDQNGSFYYKVKNSWGTEGSNNGFVYMSVAFMRLKSISVLLHKDGLMTATKEKLKL